VPADIDVGLRGKIMRIERGDIGAERDLQFGRCRSAHEREQRKHAAHKETSKEERPDEA